MVIPIDLRLFEYCELTVLTILVTYRLVTWPSSATSSNVILVQINLFKYIPCTSYRFLIWLNIWGHLNYWEATPFCTIPLPTCESVCFRNLSHMPLLWPGSDSLARALIRLGWRDLSCPSFISQYGLFPGPCLLPSNSLVGLMILSIGQHHALLRQNMSPARYQVDLQDKLKIINICRWFTVLRFTWGIRQVLNHLISILKLC